jgi:hypothetical protein
VRLVVGELIDVRESDVSWFSTRIHGYNRFMRQPLALLIPPMLAGGCSLIYNEKNIPHPDPDAKVFMDAPDAMVDANPNDLMITGVESPALLEGQGDEGSRAVVLLVRGVNIVNGATVTVMPTAGTAMIEVVNEPPVISGQSDLIAVKVIARVDTALTSAMMKDVVVKVSQPTPMGGNVEGTTMWQLKGLDELDNAHNNLNTATPEDYSHVALTNPLAINGTGKVIVRAMASISITSAIDVSAVTATNSATPGPGGFPGGGVEGDGMGPGFGKKGVAGSKGGGGAGFVTPGEDGGSNIGSGGVMTGDPLITRYATNAGSGGGGGNGFGGAGGGTVELSAGGNVTVGAISANGSDGKGGLLAAGGGGGAGGVVVVRAGATATLNGISVNGGAGGTGTLALGVGGAGRAGRVRIDAAAISGNAGAPHLGLMFDANTSAIVRSPMPTLHLLGSAGDRFDMQRANQSFAPLGTKKTIDFGGATALDETTPMLDAGFNRLCIIPENSGLGNPESRNCIDLYYLP